MKFFQPNLATSESVFLCAAICPNVCWEKWRSPRQSGSVHSEPSVSLYTDRGYFIAMPGPHTAMPYPNTAISPMSGLHLRNLSNISGGGRGGAAFYIRRQISQFFGWFLPIDCSPPQPQRRVHLGLSSLACRPLQGPQSMWGFAKCKQTPYK